MSGTTSTTGPGTGTGTTTGTGATPGTPGTTTGTGAGGAQAQITRLYDTAFDRAPDAAALAFWTAALGRPGATLDSIGDAFIATPEFQARGGNLPIPEFVRLLYRQGLEREAEPEGLNFWTSGLQRNATDRGDVLSDIADSPEGVASALTQGVSQPGTTTPGTTTPGTTTPGTTTPGTTQTAQDTQQDTDGTDTDDTGTQTATGAQPTGEPETDGQQQATGEQDGDTDGQQQAAGGENPLSNGDTLPTDTNVSPQPSGDQVTASNNNVDTDITWEQVAQQVIENFEQTGSWFYDGPLPDDQPDFEAIGQNADDVFS
jgi:hypothetical protein